MAIRLSPLLTYRIETVLELTLIFMFSLLVQGLLLGDISLQTIFHASLVSCLLGLPVAVMEMLVYPKVLVKHSFPVVILFKTLGNLLIVLLTILALSNWIALFIHALNPYIVSRFHITTEGEGLSLIVSNGHFFGRFVLFYLFVCFNVTFLYQMIQKMGRRVFWNFVRGKYHQPHEEDRIFLFLDLKGSTRLAEQLGHHQFSRFLSDCFHDLTIPLLETEAEVYQYVGDEVVITWLTPAGIRSANCLECFYKVKEKLHQRQAYYLANYGAVPTFKGGMHAGRVVATQVGDLKSEVVYHGDVLNTASRIQEQCNRLGQELLLSGELSQLLSSAKGTSYPFTEVDHLRLRGKQDELTLVTPGRAPEAFRVLVHY
jgi:adenylate cyclase